MDPKRNLREIRNYLDPSESIPNFVAYYEYSIQWKVHCFKCLYLKWEKFKSKLIFLPKKDKIRRVNKNK